MMMSWMIVFLFLFFILQAYQCRFGDLPHPKLPALNSAELTSASYNKERQQLSWTLSVDLEPTFATWIKRLSGGQFLDY